MYPVSFENCFGWLHPGHSARGVVLFSPFGFEELCARKSYVFLAEALSARGIPVLRFDWHGTGDSIGSPLDPGLYDHWKTNADAAVEALKRHSGVTEVVAIGMRLGCFLAAQAACARNDVSRLVLLAPPASGKAWLRETATLGRIMALPNSGEAAFDGLEVAGFRFSQETVERIKSLDWQNLSNRPAPVVDLFLQSAGGNGQRLSQQMQALAASARMESFDGYDEMMCDPTASRTPFALIEAIASRIAEHAPAARARFQRPVCIPLSGYGYTETPALIGDKRPMAGVLCSPMESGDRSEAVIMLNAGAIHHIGWGRMYVDTARRLARRNIASLRLDLPGIGDSVMSGDPPVAALYARKQAAEVGAAIGWLKSRGYRKITLMGACSGAYQAFHAAIQDARVDTLVLLNQLCFEWNRSYAMQYNAWQATKSRTMQNQLAAADAAELGQATGAATKLMPLARKFAKSSLSAIVSLHAKATTAFARTNPVEAAFLQLSARGTRVLLAYSEGDAGLEELERHLGHDGERAASLPGVEMCTIANADHMLTPQPARDRFAEKLISFLDAGMDTEERCGDSMCDAQLVA